MCDADVALIGRWRLVETELWAAADLDLAGPAHIHLGRNGLGEMHFIAVSADVDYRIVGAGDSMKVEFSWDGFDDGDQRSGRGWATLQGDTLRGRIFFHRGDDSWFVARREDA